MTDIVLIKMKDGEQVIAKRDKDTATTYQIIGDSSYYMDDDIDSVVGVVTELTIKEEE